MILLKLRFGAEELNLTDWDIFYPLSGGITDNGATVSFTLYIKAPSTQINALLEYIRNLNIMAQRAKDYARGGIGLPVYIGYKVYDGNPYDTTIGRGWLWKELDGDEEPIRIEKNESWSETIGMAFIASLTLTFTTKPITGRDGEREWAWQPLYERPIGEARGAIRNLPNGGIQLYKTSVNWLANSDFELGTEGWIIGDGITATEETHFVYNGYKALRCVAAVDDVIVQSFTTENGKNYCLQFYTKLLLNIPPNDDYIAAYCDGELETTYTEDIDGWYVCTAFFAGDGNVHDVGVIIKGSPVGVVIDSIQLEETLASVPTIMPLLYGGLGRGYNFVDEEHNSPSNRYGGQYAIVINERTVPITNGTILLIWQPEDYVIKQVGTSPVVLLYNNTGIGVFYSGNIICYMGIAPSVNTTTLDDISNKTLFIFISYGTSGLRLRVFDEEGNLLGYNPACNGAYVPTKYNGYLYIGSDATGNFYQAGKILQLQIYEEELTEEQMLARVQCGVGNAELPYMVLPYYSDHALYNHNDTTPLDNPAHLSYVEFGNVPGTTHAGLLLLLQNNAATAYSILYSGLVRRNIPRPDTPAQRFLSGVFYQPPIKADNEILGADTTKETSSEGSGGYYLRIEPTTTDDEGTLRITIPLCNRPEDLWKVVGTWRILARVRTNAIDTARIRFAVQVAEQIGEPTPWVTLDNNEIWTIPNPQNLVVRIPPAPISNAMIQEYVPDDYDPETQGPYCSLLVYTRNEETGIYIDFDGIVLIPQEQEACAIVDGSSWANGRLLMLHNLDNELQWGIVVSNLRYVCSFDWSGQMFTLPVGQDSVMVFVWRNELTGYQWDIDEQLQITAFYKPRYLEMP